jgi:L-lactate dehydrogenase (cytochrome)
MLDSGVRRGTDVLKALALGASFVFVGRPFNYAASIAGEEGVRHACGILQGEVNRGMGQFGITRVSQANPAHLLRISGVPAPGMPV